MVTWYQAAVIPAKIATRPAIMLTMVLMSANATPKNVMDVAASASAALTADSVFVTVVFQLAVCFGDPPQEFGCVP